MLEDARSEVIEYAQRMTRDGLVKGTSGNVSVREGDFVAITPGATDYAAMEIADIVVVDLAGEVVDGRRNPSSELELHLELYRGHAAQAVVHTHSTFATVVSVTKDELPAIHYMVASMGGPVPVIPYRRYGSAELAAEVSQAMTGRSALIMGSHGAVTIGASLAQAYTRSLNLEWMCQVYVESINFAEPRLLDGIEIRQVAERMQTKGYLAK
ncbi:class II aldolase/adducin family protein [Microbacterium alcoholitolerans]|uniref:class II aldolase/adducin family protein n=1 Tax=unclassified Microbacterium TaxID=2609290 RepID=UPI003D180BC8